MLPSETKGTDGNAKEAYEDVAPIRANKSEIPLVEHHVPNE